MERAKRREMFLTWNVFENDVQTALRSLSSQVGDDVRMLTSSSVKHEEKEEQEQEK